jgi:intracellular sulfur oxidation DsrE/DsrF family protein
MKQMAYRLVAMLFALGLCFTSVQVSAAEKSFADTKVVLQISDNDPFKQTLVLNVANNLVKHYGPDQVDVEIVAFGPGLRLLFAENANKDRIQSLADNGVRFAACGNTVRNMSKILGEEPVLNKNATTVSAGVVRILDLEKQGYKIIKP